MHRTTLVPRSLRTKLWQAMLVAVLATLAATRVSPCQAQEPLVPILAIPVGEFRQVQMSKKQNIAVARQENPKVVRLFSDPIAPNVIQVRGEGPGMTRVFLTDEAKNTEVFEVRVTLAGEKTPDEKRKEFSDLVARAFPAASVHATIGAGDMFIVRGNPGAEASIPGITALAQRVFGGNVVVDFDRVGVQQVQLEVVVAIVNRSETRNMSFSFFNNRQDTSFASILQAPLSLTPTAFTGVQGITSPKFALAGNPNLILGVTSNTNAFAGFLQALRTEGLAKVLSEPRIVTLSGEKAYINSGGEVPTFATSSLGQAEIQYKAFGTTVEFMPKVLGDGRIFLEVHPELSDIDESLRVTLGGNTAPGFRTRRAQVTVVMEDGQTLAIGGLIQNNVNASTTKVPVLGDLPYVGAAFRNTTYLEREEELVILVTPRLVHPISCTCIPKFLPGRETRSPDDYELFLEGILEAPRGQRTVCYGQDGGWQAAHVNAYGVYPCNDASHSHMGDRFSDRDGGRGSCGSGLSGCGIGSNGSGSCGSGGRGCAGGSGGCASGACSPGTVLNPVAPRVSEAPAARMPIAESAGIEGISVETFDVRDGRIVPVSGSLPPSSDASPMPPIDPRLPGVRRSED